MKTFTKQIFRLFVLVFFVTSQTQISANDTYYYRDCHVKLNSPSSAKGVVYLEMVDRSNKNSKNPTLQTKPGKIAELKANFKAKVGQFSDTQYDCYLFAYPKEGWVLDGFVTKEDYLSHRTTKEYYLQQSLMIQTMSGDKYTIAQLDTLSDTKNDPFAEHLMASYKFSAKTSIELYAIFRKAVTLSVLVNTPGTLKDEIQKHMNPKEVDNLNIQGELDDNDFAYLKELSYNLTRIDMSKVITKEIPSSTFENHWNLYEIKLPDHGLKKIGNKAFYNCRSLKSFEIPADWEIGENAFEGCITWNIKF